MKIKITAELIPALKRYQPTKIAVESTPAGIGKLNAPLRRRNIPPF